MVLSYGQKAHLTLFPVTPEPLVGGSGADALDLGGFPYGEAFVGGAGHEDAPYLKRSPHVLVAVH